MKPYSIKITMPDNKTYEVVRVTAENRYQAKAMIYGMMCHLQPDRSKYDVKLIKYN